MCGICGILCARGQTKPTDFELIETMTDSMTHRGPNDRGTWHDDRIALGHRRLAVIDLSSAGRQPMCNEDGTIHIVYNGEVYNFQELKERFRLVERGHVFHSRTDTEVVVHLFEELGLAAVDELNGMFAFAIWDSGARKLHLVRDRYGIKPLFYTWQGDRFLFASEIKAILKDTGVPRRVNLQAVHDFLSLNYVPGEQTAFEGIYELAPAHWMTIDSQGHVTSGRYWDLPFDVDESLDANAIVHRAGQLLEESIRRQLIADVPIGVMLSGGMDSSTIVALMSGMTSEPIHTYAVGFEDPSYNELPYARIVSDQFGTIHREVVITPQMVRDLLPGYLHYMDEPYADGSAIPTYYVCEMAKQDVVVVLSGEGGDEAFAGYETYAAYQVYRWFRQVPRWIRKGVLAPLVNRLPVSHRKLSLEFKMKRFLGGQDLSPVQAHLWWRIVLTESQKAELYSDAVLEQLASAPTERHFAQVYERSRARDVLNRLIHVDSAIFLPDDLMIKNDRMSMAHSLEARVPMMDHRLTEFMSRVPLRRKLPCLRKKHVLRRVMQGRLAGAVLRKKKVGLEMPYSRWLKYELNDVLMEYCGPQSIVECGLFRPEAVKKLIDQHVANYYDHGRSLWGLLNFMMWHRSYIA